MNTFNSVLSTVFDLIFGWFGSASAWVDILLWSILGGIVALIVYKHASNQKGIERAKNGIKVHLMEIRLFQDDLLGVLVATGKILFKNALYIGHNIVPMLIMFVPMMAILFQLEANYALAPIVPGSTVYLDLTIDRDVAPELSTRDVSIEVPTGVRLLAHVPAPDEVVFKLLAEKPGDYTLKLKLGDEMLTKGMAVGGAPRKVPFMRTKSVEGYLYPGEAGLPAESAAYEISLPYPDRDLGPMPSGESGVLLTFFVVSIAAGLALKGVFDVTL